MAVSEKKVYTDILKLYKNFPCLWDCNHELYNNKGAREQAFGVLLEKFKALQENATIADVKKKIENMRTAFKRELKKVKTSKENGKEHNPSLWYYNLLTFLSNQNDDNRLFHEVTVNSEYDYDTLDEEDYDERKKKEKMKHKTSSSEFLQLDEEPKNNLEPTAYGRTVGLQLSELDPYQRILAEKLISDIIFNARLDKLTTDSSILLNK